MHPDAKKGFRGLNENRIKKSCLTLGTYLCSCQCSVEKNPLTHPGRCWPWTFHYSIAHLKNAEISLCAFWNFWEVCNLITKPKRRLFVWFKTEQEIHNKDTWKFGLIFQTLKRKWMILFYEHSLSFWPIFCPKLNFVENWMWIFCVKKERRWPKSKLIFGLVGSALVIVGLPQDWEKRNLNGI